MKSKKLFSAILIAVLALSPAAIMSGCVGGVYGSPEPAPTSSVDTGNTDSESSAESSEEPSEISERMVSVCSSEQDDSCDPSGSC